MTVRSSRWGLAGLAWLTYAIYYLGRVNFSVAAPALASERGMSGSEIGLLAAAFFWVYALGGVAMGRLADRHGTRLLVAGGLLGSAAVNLVFGLSRAWLVLLVAWTLNGLFQAMGWAPLLGGLTRWVPADRLETAAVMLGASFVAGSTLGLAVGGVLVEWAGVAGGFVGPAVVMAAMGIVWWRADSDPVDTGDARESRRAATVGSPRLRTARLWPAVALVGLAYVAILVWTPLYLSDVHGMSPGRAGLLTAILIGFGILGPMAASRWFGRGSARHRRLGVLLVMSALCFGLVPVVDHSLAAAFALLTACSVLVAAAASVVLGGFTFSGPKRGVGTVGGILALVFNLGGGLGGVLLGRLVDASAWQQVFAVLAGAMAGGAVTELALAAASSDTRGVGVEGNWS